jgi:hypothetical protein
MSTAPSATDSTESLADWVELQALKSPEKQFSLESLVRVIRRGGSTDAFESSRGDSGSEASQRVAADAFGEIENRVKACGAKNRYPFKIQPGLLKVRNEWPSSPYITMLVLSATRPTSGHGGTAVLFERLCCKAAIEYIGGSRNGVRAFRFGSPRRPPLSKLRHAIDHLCKQVAEGGGCRHPHKANHTGDEGLDVVAWRDFPDLKEGKLIAFGQCAAGERAWENKLSELDGDKFVQKWFKEMPVVKPIRLFFLPRRVAKDDWHNSGIDGGILFDRCRIVSCLGLIDASLEKDCKAATKTLLRKI